ncbi:MAG TPA: hypothetical protein VEX43_19020 [Chthoniobacterales bacterium]|nr:hypothetical protein [Chthoniobacterales bacterium]
MVLVSIHPFAVRKIFLLVIGVLGLSSAFCFADPLFMTRRYAAAGDQERQARRVITPQATLDRSSMIRLSFKNSPERSEAIRTIAFLSFDEETRKIGPNTSTSIAAGLQAFAIEGCPEVGANSRPSIFECMSGNGL